jgi:hypothetical protein
VLAKGYEGKPELMKMSDIMHSKYENYKDKAHRYVGNKRYYGPKQAKTSRTWSIT